MADKDRERFYIGKLWECLPDAPAGQVVDGESPDFSFDTAGGRLGIEITAFYYPPASGDRPHQEVQMLKDRVTTMAHRAAALA
jgi:hypothetical protein